MISFLVGICQDIFRLLFLNRVAFSWKIGVGDIISCAHHPVKLVLNVAACVYSLGIVRDASAHMRFARIAVLKLKKMTGHRNYIVGIVGIFLGDHGHRLGMAA